MKVHIINGKLVSIIPEEDYGDDISGKYDKDLTHFSEFVIEESDDEMEILNWKVTKNRPTGEKLSFMSLKDAVEFCQIVDPSVQRHMGYINLKTDQSIKKFLKTVSPMWASKNK